MIYVFLLSFICVFYIGLKKDYSSIAFGRYVITYEALYCVLVGFFFFILASLRHTLVGTDTQNYRNIFYSIKYLGPNYFTLDENILSQELGYYYFIDQLGEIFDFQQVITVVSLVYVSVFTYIIYKYSKIKWLSFLYFLFFGYFIFICAMRQALALSLTIIAFNFAIKKRIIPYFIFVVLAVSCHVTALLFIPTYWLIKIRLNRRILIIALFVFIGLFIFQSTILKYLILVSAKEYQQTETGGWFTLLLYLFLFISSYNITIEKNKSVSYEANSFLVMLLIMLLIFPLSKINPAFSRMYLYFQVYSVIIFPNTVCSIKNKNKRVMFTLIFILVGGYNFFYLNSKAGIRVLPYVFYWEDYHKINPDVKYLMLDY